MESSVGRGETGEEGRQGKRSSRSAALCSPPSLPPAFPSSGTGLERSWPGAGRRLMDVIWLSWMSLLGSSEQGWERGVGSLGMGWNASSPHHQRRALIPQTSCNFHSKQGAGSWPCSDAVLGRRCGSSGSTGWARWRLTPSLCLETKQMPLLSLSAPRIT